jgi:hypothetical protein
MTTQRPAAALTVPGLTDDLPITPLPIMHNGYDVTFLNGHAEIIVPLGVTPDGQEVQLTVSDPDILGKLVYLAMLAQGRMGVAKTGRAA